MYSACLLHRQYEHSEALLSKSILADRDLVPAPLDAAAGSGSDVVFPPATVLMHLNAITGAEPGASIGRQGDAEEL